MVQKSEVKAFYFWARFQEAKIREQRIEFRQQKIHESECSLLEHENDQFQLLLSYSQTHNFIGEVVASVLLFSWHSLSLFFLQGYPDVFS